VDEDLPLAAPLVDGKTDFGDLTISQDAIIATVAEAVLSQSKRVRVVDADKNIVGSVHCTKMIHILFGRDDAADVGG
jgi:hypothetical protein